ncbi:hypothetical protein EXN66_Car015312 [Channa argus]|uniref:Uncharacterized protein n=1 Tax=Channa argus TaxID=215402 RepID=A0A6G1QAQ0_CHAAH|nr:hypothetical protein EXN66_Car015312 [Channa argus]
MGFSEQNFMPVPGLGVTMIQVMFELCWCFVLRSLMTVLQQEPCCETNMHM